MMTDKNLWRDLDEAWSWEGERVAGDLISEVLRLERPDGVYYLKRYSAAGKMLRRLFGRSRPRGEYENLRLFARLGIATADIAGFEQHRAWGRFRRAALVTREIPDTTDLARMAREADPKLRDRRWVAEVSRQLADYTARLHRIGFCHNDLKWRNVMVSRGAPPRVYLIDCPIGRRRYGLLRRRGRIKDLACLDRHARVELSRSQRLRFYLLYRGLARLDARGRREIRGVLGFYDGRDQRLTKRLDRLYKRYLRHRLTRWGRRPQ
ncbi:lipopolysaccharide kinase InaA family protein [Alkalilimnicola sp. S0819]|uniref:lipopolysaccharide kinase InaA family protein n=1 Tax=Alkalilimnicola sp. S0819 TaxID=2613922 RepID=UPI001262213F|nr:lipopolysaccharide kinase InaA family protein [Alkalilimnicola sp. S0819]KAB7628203.1 phosphotransferase [Alkalilimnicola sp. S0819]MPQ15094.1 phosphotransferase [Alkalilimnicola sp. S0819]